MWSVDFGDFSLRDGVSAFSGRVFSSLVSDNLDGISLGFRILLFFPSVFSQIAKCKFFIYIHIFMTKV